MSKIAPYGKAVVGFQIAGLTALYVALSDGSVTASEWVGVALAALGTLAGVYATPWRPNKKEPT